jgi:hypothetical protein
MMAPVHRNFPQTSDFAEHIAFCFVSLHASVEDPIEVVTYSASVISYYHQSLGGTATSYNNVQGGIWDELKTETVTQTHKINSLVQKLVQQESAIGGRGTAVLTR